MGVFNSCGKSNLSKFDRTQRATSCEQIRARGDPIRLDRVVAAGKEGLHVADKTILQSGL